MSRAFVGRSTEPDEIFTPQETCRYLKITMGSLYQRRCRKEIAYIKMGRLLRFRRSALDAYLKACEQEGQNK